MIFITTIYFVRHAKPNYENHNDSLRELTEQGLKDRELVTNFLQDKNINVVLSSPYKRSVDTIKHFADNFNFDIITIEDFKERRVDSIWIEDFETFCKNQWNDFNFKLKDGETLKEVQERNINALNNVLKDYENQNIVIGSHGTALSTIINYYDKSFNYECFQKYRNLMPWVVKFTFEKNKCVNIEHFDLFNI